MLENLPLDLISNTGVQSNRIIRRRYQESKCWYLSTEISKLGGHICTDHKKLDSLETESQLKWWEVQFIWKTIVTDKWSCRFHHPMLNID